MKTASYINIAALALAGWGIAAQATPLHGNAVTYDPVGQLVASIPITGDLDSAGNTLQVDPFEFFGTAFNTTSIELLGAGTYTRNDPNSAALTATVSPGQLGAYLEFQWGFNNLGTFMVWDVSPTGTGNVYTTADSDGDGIPGHAFASGAFVGFNMVYDFYTGDPPPSVEVSINIPGGTTQECNTTDGSNVSLAATVNLGEGTSLGSIDWIIDGASAGSGATVSTFLALGSHSIEVTATATTGESGSAAATLTVQDTTPPDLDVAFLDRAGAAVTAAPGGSRVTTQITATDICDPAPQTGGTLTPVFAVADGDTIRVRSGRVNTVNLPVTALELTGNASDASGNTASEISVLSITD